MLKAIIVEIKHTILKSFYHFLRFGGLLLIPFIYGFSYIYAFYDPFKRVENIPLAIVTTMSKDASGHDKPNVLSDAIAHAMGVTTSLEVGDLKMNIKMEHIYIHEDASGKISQSSLNNIERKHHATIYLPKFNQQIIMETAKSIINLTKPNSNKKDIGLVISNIKKIIKTIASGNKKIKIINNFKKNYLIAFGIDLGSSMIGGGTFIAKKIVEAMKDEAIISLLNKNGILNISSPIEKQNYKATLDNFSKIAFKFKPIIIEPDIKGDKNKYGYGLAPFFISVAMWIGGMVMTFAVHKKIYDRTITPGKRYLAKWLLITFGTIIQATILMTSLYFIGFNKLGISHWWSMYTFAIFIGMVFSAVIQAIRFIVPHRNIGIFLVIILLVLQMASGGGLFPIETQNGFYRFMNIILPMGHSVDLIRETIFNTNWTNIFYQIGYMSLYLLIVPIAIAAYHYQSMNLYKINGWILPPKLQIKYGIKKFAKIKKEDK